MIEMQFIIYGENANYRVRSNPDSRAVDGTEGIVLEWRNAGEETWEGCFHIGPSEALEVSTAIKLLMTGRPE